MLKGLTSTPPVIGRITIGKMVKHNDRLLPTKDNEFTITTHNAETFKLRRIPIRLLFDDPTLNLRAAYHLFDRRNSRPLCVGNGETCKRVNNGKIEQHPCNSPECCPFAQEGRCKPYARMNVRIGDNDMFSSFIFRTTGYNSIRTLATRLIYFHAVSNGKLSTLPLELRLLSKTTKHVGRKKFPPHKSEPPKPTQSLRYR